MPRLKSIATQSASFDRTHSENGVIHLDVEELSFVSQSLSLAVKYWQEKIRLIEDVKADGWRHKAGLARAEIAAAHSIERKLATHRQFQLPDHDWFCVPIEKAEAAENPRPPALTPRERNDAEVDRVLNVLSGHVRQRGIDEGVPLRRD